MRRGRAKVRPVAEINVVPYIDVMMVLLVIFIATAPVVMQGVSVDLPQAESQAMSEDQKVPVICTVDKQGNYFVEFKSATTKVQDLSELTSMVQNFRSQDKTVPVVVQGDMQATYNSVVQLMNALKQAGVEQVGLVTEPIAEKR